MIAPAVARRLAVTRQRLAGPRPSADAAGILEVTRDLGALQLDPIAAVARSHLLVLQSRLGPYDPAHLDTLLWDQRLLFEYWAHCASIVLTEDYPIHAALMRAYAAGETLRAGRARAWALENAALRDRVIARLRHEGPLRSAQFETGPVEGWLSTGWSNDHDVGRMLDYLWLSGEIMVARRHGGQKVWDLAERCLPPTVTTTPLPEPERTWVALERALRALGVATAAQLRTHFTRGRYPGLPAALATLERDQRIARVAIQEGTGRQPWPGVWYVHADDLPLLDRLAAGDWAPRATLLSPFDNLLCDRQRTAVLFDFDFRIEIYVPKARRQYGYYVMPLLYGDQLLGRADPTFDRRSKRLTLNAFALQPGVAPSAAQGIAAARAVEELAQFLGAVTIDADIGQLPAAWRKPFRAVAG